MAAMAKKSIEARQRKRERLVAQYADKRKALKDAGELTLLDKLPKNSSKVRLRNRCALTGRPRGYIRMFGISRITFRDLASQDPIADYLTRIRNAQAANHRFVEIPASNLKKKITEILYEKGYILKYKFEDEGFGGQGVIKIALKYDAASKTPVIKSLKRVSTPGLRQYSGSQ
ncbi:unnamed protein product, partial [Darwinula stevensoni]